MIGRKLSHFEITGHLGAGGMGEVYLARDTQLERRVALKVLPADLADDPDRLKRLIREAKALAALDHPHIVTVFSVEEDEGVHFLTMAFVEGSSLEVLIPQDGFPIEQLLDFAVPLADALRAAHERGIVHRDLKPANVMVDSEGRLRVLDFGLAKRDAEVVGEMSQVTTQGLTEQMTREGTILGSYPYMSPEQAEGRSVDTRSDLFSFGTMLYEMTSGVRPFEGDTSIALITAILRDTPRSLAMLRPDAPQQLIEVIERCLEKKPDDRYHSAEELRSDLEELRRKVVQGVAAPVDTAVPDAREPAASWVGASWNHQLLIAAAIVAVILGATWWWRSRGPVGPTPAAESVAATAEAENISSIAVLPLANLTGDPEQEFFADGMTEALITDLSKIGALKVISRSSVMQYKETEKRVSEIATELGVDAVLTGSVIREGDRVGISAQLVSAETEDNLWADRYEQDMTSILSLQADIAQAVAAEIEITLTEAERRLLGAARAVDPEAHEAYLKGMFHLQKFTAADFDQALKYFETALDLDPEYAQAHAGVAAAWIYVNQLGVAPPTETIPKVLPALERALELDPLLAEAHLVQAFVKEVWEWDWEGANASYLRAIELNPSYADAHIFYSHFATKMGRPEEGTAAGLRALELDPLNPFFRGLYGIQVSLTGRLDEAVDELRRSHEMAPGFDFGRTSLAYILGHTRRLDESLDELRTHFSLIGDREVVAAMDVAEEKGGYTAAMGAVADILDARAETEWIHAFEVINLYDLAENMERAIEWLERGYDRRDPDMPYLGMLWLSDQLRSTPGYEDLVRRMDFPDAVMSRLDPVARESDP